MPPCSCGVFFDTEVALERHHRHFPEHRQATQQAAPEEQPQPKVPRTGAVARTVRAKEVANMLQQKVATMRLHKVMRKAHIRMGIELAEIALGYVTAMVEEALRGQAGGSAAKEILAHLSSVKDVLSGLHDIDKQCEQVASGALQVIARPLLASSAEAKKKFAFLSLQELLIDTLQNDRHARHHILRSSAEWKTGAFATPRRIATDVVHGERFAASLLAKAATAGEKNDVRLGIKAWDDEFTVRSHAARTPCPRARPLLLYSAPLASL